MLEDRNMIVVTREQQSYIIYINLQRLKQEIEVVKCDMGKLHYSDYM